MIPLIVLSIVFVLIAVRQVGAVRLPIWQVMLGGAAAVLLTGRISPAGAWAAVDREVMAFLFGVFVIGRALEESGYLSHLSYQLFRRARSADALVFRLIFGSGIASAFLMNDTLAVIGTPVVLLLSRLHRLDPKPLLLSLAFGVTIGSVMSPVGNPQNLLVALNAGIPNPFVTFLRALFVPTMISLLAAYGIVKYGFGSGFSDEEIRHVRPFLTDLGLAHLCRWSLALFAGLIVVKAGLAFVAPRLAFGLVPIALISALPILLGSPKRLRLVRGIDWTTLVFFASMFVLMRSVWETEWFRPLAAGREGLFASTPVILSGSILMSQVLSNVPLVALVLPVLIQSQAPVKAFVALAAGSTLAGNLFILGAASNVIIIEGAERRTGATLTFMDFARAGLPLTFLTGLVYWIWLDGF